MSMQYPLCHFAGKKMRVKKESHTMKISLTFKNFFPLSFILSFWIWKRLKHNISYIIHAHFNTEFSRLDLWNVVAVDCLCECKTEYTLTLYQFSPNSSTQLGVIRVKNFHHWLKKSDGIRTWISFRSRIFRI